MDPETSRSRLGLTGSSGGVSTAIAGRRRLHSHLTTMSIGGSLGPNGKVVLFDNGRLADGWATVAMLGDVMHGAGDEGAILSEQEIVRRLDQSPEYIRMAKMFAGLAGSDEP